MRSAIPPSEDPKREQLAEQRDSTPRDSIATRKVAILAADGVDEGSVSDIQDALTAAGAQGSSLDPMAAH